MKKLQNKYKTSLIPGFLALVFPFVASAQTGVIGLLNAFAGLIRPLNYVIFGLCVVYFFWGGVQFIANADDAKTRNDGKNRMIYGVIAIFVYVSIFGLINFIRLALNI